MLATMTAIKVQMFPTFNLGLDVQVCNIYYKAGAKNISNNGFSSVNGT